MAVWRMKIFLICLLLSGSAYQEDVNRCGDLLCSNGGSCLTGVDSFRCICPEGFTGVQCESTTVVSPCATSPCNNSGTCVDDVEGFRCVCLPSWTGERCQTMLDRCQPQPCVNGATCEAEGEGYRCSCPPGFTGTNCESGVSACVPNPVHTALPVLTPQTATRVRAHLDTLEKRVRRK
ncbi:fibropellin-3-like [Pomacea canaliculata]|uniref:fibropellin-3-like n=1 Tax=Pomacea canaliculata TaxID=400727 RepID=UPI000D7376E8|nr:fibropellin-3-like [Pomacea canaliculata]XP_025113506.1 fibropellin-3-like [Pomacea canaliculata]XP_025113507.1 fibropellin-3-like [Pomacea canaliculata]